MKTLNCDLREIFKTLLNFPKYFHSHPDIEVHPSRHFTYPISLLFSLCRKARRKERDGDASQSDTKIYLEESVLELLKFTSADLRSMVDLPAGVDYNEWLASYSEYHACLRSHPGDFTDDCSPSPQLYKYLNM